MNLRRALGWALPTSQDQTIPTESLRPASRRARPHLAEVRNSYETRAYTVPGITDLATRNILR